MAGGIVTMVVLGIGVVDGDVTFVVDDVVDDDDDDDETVVLIAEIEELQIKNTYLR